MTDIKVAVVGRGRVGQSLGRALLHCGCEVTMASARGSGEEVASKLLAAIREADTILITVPDSVIPEVAQLLNSVGVGAGQAVLHTSGAVGCDVLAVLSERGVATGSLHPLMTFTSVGGQPDLFAGTPAIIERSDSRGVTAARELASLLSMEPILEIESDRKASYHAAAVFASNYLVVLAGIAERLARESGIEEARGLFGPLMNQTLRNLEAHPPEQVLTGPIARRDDVTVAAHLAVLDEELAELYRLLAREARRLT